jgi:hypothetical protein
VEGLVEDLAVGLVEEDSVVDSVAMEEDSVDSVVDSAAAYIDISTVRVSLSIPPPSSSILSIFSPRQFPRFDLQLLSPITLFFTDKLFALAFAYEIIFAFVRNVFTSICISRSSFDTRIVLSRLPSGLTMISFIGLGFRT